jgi:beta-1,4-mannosyltransferase
MTSSVRARGTSKRERDSAVTVLLSLDPPDGTTRYVDQVVTCLPSSVAVRYFSWATALFASYDVVHVHWPEFLARGRTPVIRSAKRTLLLLFLVRVTILRTPVVRTLHNEHPHEPSSRLENALLRALNARVTTYIRLNDRTLAPGPAPVESIRHGDYVERFRPAVTSRAAVRKPGRVLLIGLLRPYKGIDGLIDAVEDSRSVRELRIVGRPADDGYAAELLRRTSSLPRAATHFGFVDDDVLVDEVRAAELVVLPYRSIHNSGILFVALSLGTPVLASRSETVEDIRREVGDLWIQTYDGVITGADVDRSLELARRPRPPHPDFAGRDWETVGRAHAEVYLAARSRGLR